MSAPYDWDEAAAVLRWFYKGTDPATLTLPQFLTLLKKIPPPAPAAPSAGRDPVLAGMRARIDASLRGA